MSDVERICEVNHERRRWAEEYDEKRCCQHGGQGSGRPTDWERRKAYRNTALGCAMFTGGASAFVGIGLSTGRWLTVAVGLVVAALFLCCGLWSERLAEEDDA